MVTDEAYAALQAEKATLERRVAELRDQLASALQRIADLEAKKTPPPALVKATKPRCRSGRTGHRGAHVPRSRTTRGRARRPRWSWRTRQVVDRPPPPAVVVTAHHVQRGW